MAEKKRSNKEQLRLEDYIIVYLENKNKRDELEVRFATKSNYNPLKKIRFDNTIAKLRSLGFEIISSNEYHLNIQNQYINPNTGRESLSSIRTTIAGIHNIQKYCKTNTFNMDNIPSYITFMEKFRKNKDRDSRERYLPLDNHDFEFRLNYKEERQLDPRRGRMNNILMNWKDSKKVFRLIKRTTLKHPKYPFKIDCSILKTSSNIKSSNQLKPTFTVQESNLFNNVEHYEIELELINEEAFQMGPDILIPQVKLGIKQVLSGLQNTNYPTSYSEMNEVLKSYLDLTLPENKYKEIENDSYYNRKKRKSRKYFIGPSSISLEMNNIVPLNSENATMENINLPYTVTEKADGIRKLLYIAPNKKVYLIDINLEVEFTGLVCKNLDYLNTIIDGEHVLYDKNKNYINYYLCFDIYWLNSNDLRVFPFVKVDGMKYDAKISDKVFRYNELVKSITNFDLVPVSTKGEKMHIEAKKFYPNMSKSIFQQCNTILEEVNNGMFLYETDGLIFTPIDKSVGSTKLGILENNKTWNLSFKWKPSEYNTIDFMVTTKKNSDGSDFVGNIMNNGENFRKDSQITSFKTLILRVGFDERKHGVMNPCDNLINYNFKEDTRRNAYKPVPFYPTEPTPNYPIHLCNIPLKKKDGTMKMLIENGEEEIMDNMIVEFRFDKSADKFWQWKPIRVRYDKTSDLRKGGRNYGNAYHVAQSVWRSIHFPITEDIITSGENIDMSNKDDNVYYNRKNNETYTKALRDFHNRYVKKKLIMSTTNNGNTLMDMTVGKAGDMQKWMDAKLSFVFGIDSSRDNIEHKMDGACVRYIKTRRKKKKMFDALFIHGNSSLNILNTEAAFSEKGKMIINALHGKGSKDRVKLGEGVYKQWGIAKDGFDVISNQFSIHYFFKSNLSVNEFIRNCAENCKLGGYCIGTCYDGTKIFNALKKKKKGENIFYLKNDKKIWSIKKMYEKDTFENNETCLGYDIEVYQESINKSFVEYLVNFEYFITLMLNYGFALLSKDEANEIGLPSSMGSFESLYKNMISEIERKQLNNRFIGEAMNMSEEEKNISFFNNYFVFKKIRNVNVKNVFEIEIAKTQEINDINDYKTKDMIREIMAQKIQRVFIRKFKKKFKLPTE